MNRYDYYCQQTNFFNDLYTKAKDENKLVCIKFNDTNKDDYWSEIYFDVQLCKIKLHGCHRCKNIYPNVIFSGKFYDKDINSKGFDYFGRMSSFYLMCKCDTSNEDWNNPVDLPSLLFDVNIERNYSYFCKYFIDSSFDIQLIDKPVVEKD